MWDTTAVRQNGDIRSLRLEGSLNGSLPNGYWRAKTYFYDSGKGIPGAIVSNVWKRPERQWDKKISMPYGIMVNPVNKDIYLTDAANYVYPGTLICFDRYGKKKWQVQTGDIPAHFALLYE
jgi:hypothetical protein